MNPPFCLFLFFPSLFISHTRKGFILPDPNPLETSLLGSNCQAERELRQGFLLCSVLPGPQGLSGEWVSCLEETKQSSTWPSEQQKCAVRVFFFDGERNKASIKGKFSGQALAMQPRLAGNLRILLPQRSHCWENWQLNSPGLKFFYSKHQEFNSY